MEFGNGNDYGYGTEFVEDYGATEPVGGSGGGYGETLPPDPQGGGYGKTAPVTPPDMDWGNDMNFTGDDGFSGGETMDPTLPSNNGGGFTSGDFKRNPGVEDYEDVTRPTMYEGQEEGFTPVVGWLVCIDGPSKGADYRLRVGYNYIGRSENMDVCIKGDNAIGRERHAMVAYDQEERVFFFGPADGKSIVRLNGKMVMVPSEIHANDRLKIGSTQLMFVPLCGERFNWDV